MAVSRIYSLSPTLTLELQREFEKDPRIAGLIEKLKIDNDVEKASKLSQKITDLSQQVQNWKENPNAQKAVHLALGIATLSIVIVLTYINCKFVIPAFMYPSINSIPIAERETWVISMLMSGYTLFFNIVLTPIALYHIALPFCSYSEKLANLKEKKVEQLQKPLANLEASTAAIEQLIEALKERNKIYQERMDKEKEVSHVFRTRIEQNGQLIQVLNSHGKSIATVIAKAKNALQNIPKGKVSFKFWESYHDFLQLDLLR